MQNNQTTDSSQTQDHIYDPLQNIIFLSLPEGTERKIEKFTIDSKHLIPVELPPGKTEAELTDLSWEMIISAMLKIFAYKPEHEDIPYYREFIHTVQPNLIAELTRTGVIKAESKDFDVAEEIFLALNNFAPEESATFINLAFVFEELLSVYEKSENPLWETYTEKAFTTYMNGLEKHPDSIELHYHFAYFALKNNNLSKALEHFEYFMGLAPEDDRCSEIAGIVDEIKKQHLDDQVFAEAFDLIKLGKETEAIEKADQFLHSNPTIWNAWFLKGWAQRRIGRYEDGKKSLQQCLELESNNIDIYNELAICCMEIGDFTEAAGYLRKALTLEPENVKIISNFGVLELKKENRTEALRFFHAAHEIDPDDAIAAEYIRKLSE